jgi:hypothetical protein
VAVKKMYLLFVLVVAAYMFADLIFGFKAFGAECQIEVARSAITGEPQ